MKTSMTSVVVGICLTSGWLWADALPADLPTVPVAAPVQPIACWAVFSRDNAFVGNYVGGGCPLPYIAEARTIDEGTWGWDYRGCLLPRRGLLGWWHGRRFQGGTGAYRTDGPRYHPREEEGSHEH